MGHITFLLNGKNHKSRMSEALLILENIRVIWPRHIANKK